MLNIHLLNDLGITPLGIYRREMKAYILTETDINVHSSFICNSQKLETSQMSINKWTDKKILVCPNFRIKRNVILICCGWLSLLSCRVREARHKRVIITWLHLYKILENCLEFCQKWQKADGCLRQGVVRDIKKLLRDDRNVCHLNCGDNFTGICICRN